jgi:hypothetical protein
MQQDTQPDMQQVSAVTSDQRARSAPPRWRRWPDWAAYAAGAWSLLYGLLGLAWTLGWGGYPFGEQAAAAGGSLLGDVPAATGAPVVAGLGLAGTAVALAMARPRGRRVPGPLLLGFGWAAAATLLLAVTDARVLMVLGYLPALLFGLGADAVDWPVLNQFLCVGGGALWAAAALAFQRRRRDACGYCGRGANAAGPDGEDRRPGPRWGRWATWVAVVAPLPYAATRLAWAFGVPLGVDADFMAMYEADYVAKGVGLWRFTLGGMALGGSVLTMGLVQRWGEVFPRWIPFLAGRRVPPALAIVPASLVTVAVTVASVSVLRGVAAEGGVELELGPDSWGPAGPILLWLPWGVALGAATVAYHLRRRDRCRRCGRL